MARVIKPILVGALVLGAAVVGVGIAAGFGATFAAGTLGAGIASAVGTSIIVGTGISALQGGLSYFQRRPRQEAAGITGRMSLSDQVNQWIAVGETAVPTQMIYWGTAGAENKELSIIFAHACHRIEGFVSLRINDADTAFPTPSGAYAGILTVQTATGTQTSNPFTDVQGPWNDAGRELALSHFRWTFDEEKLRTGLPQNLQFVVKGIRVYDPRRDSTRGGTGSMRADDESTWAYEVGGSVLGTNPALVHISYLLGWRKNGKLWAGQGEDPANIDYAAHIAAANVCDELVAGQRRYSISGLLGIGVGEAHNINRGKILACCAGRPVDNGGLLGMWAAHDDTGAVAMAFDQRDFVGDLTWEPLPDGQTRNTARGSFLDPEAGWTAQPYPELQPADLLALDNDVEQADGGLDFGMTTTSARARRLANIRLRESRQGVLIAPLRLKALGADVTDIVTFTVPSQGWTAKKFRVESKAIARDVVTLRCRAVAASDYAEPASATLTPPTAPDTIGYVPTFQDGANVTAPANANRVPYSVMEGDRGWAVLFNPSALTVTSGYGEFQGLRFFRAIATATAAGQVVSINTGPLATPAFKLNPGERVLVQARVENTNTAGGAWALELWGFEIDGVTQTIIGSATGGATSIGAGTVWFFVDVPAWAVKGRIELRGTSASAGTMQLAISEPLVTSAVAGQTVRPPFTPGPNAADGADVTADALVTLRRGDWQSGVVYLRGQSVVRNRSSYVALVNHTSDAGNGPPGANWGVVADGGVDGAPGATGPAGPQGVPGVDGVDGIDGEDGKLIEFIWQRAPSQPATPTGNGIPLGWSDNPPAGSDPLWMSKGKQELDGTLIGSWSTPVRHDGPPGATGATGPQGPAGATGATGPQGPAGVSAPPVKALTSGAAQFDPIRLENGQTVTVDAALFLNTGGTAGSCTLEIQSSIHALNSWANLTGGSATDTQPTTEPVELVISGATFTNTSGQAQLYDIRTVSVRRSRTVNDPLSYMAVV